MGLLDQYQIQDKNDKLICSGDYMEVIIPWYATILTDEAFEKRFPGADKQRHKLNLPKEKSPFKLLAFVDVI